MRCTGLSITVITLQDSSRTWPVLWPCSARMGLWTGARCLRRVEEVLIAKHFPCGRIEFGTDLGSLMLKVNRKACKELRKLDSSR